MLGAAAASFELALSGTTTLAVVLPAMLGTHALIGIGEALQEAATSDIPSPPADSGSLRILTIHDSSPQRMKLPPRPT